ncbi:nucleolar protein 16 [Cylas formicarius]|uniref:nucleolar protein 16 n=1 Tax=Cylas formicarius TaxID=197179 RepID=UPI0029585375|nr:nucleolar protein 16 [Cylas formicarius]
MTKLRKQRRRKVYRYNVNRKRMRNKVVATGKIECAAVKTEWDSRKSVETNLDDMGLSHDPNKTIKVPNKKKELKDRIADSGEWRCEPLQENQRRPKTHVAESLEADAKAPREHKFRLPKSHVEWITYLMKKYGNDYKAMERDRKNYYQETWKQLRQKIKMFKKIPAHYNKYLAENGLVADFEEPQLSDGEL